jgi:hypothetical protein
VDHGLSLEEHAEHGGFYMNFPHAFDPIFVRKGFGNHDILLLLGVQPPELPDASDPDGGLEADAPESRKHPGAAAARVCYQGLDERLFRVQEQEAGREDRKASGGETDDEGAVA